MTSPEFGLLIGVLLIAPHTPECFSIRLGIILITLSFVAMIGSYAK